MNKIAVMTDTNSGIIPEDAAKYGIFLMKMPFIVNGEEHLEYTDMTYSEFFEKLSAGAEVSTSQPAPGALIEMWDEILKDYDELIYFPMSGGLSGTCATAKALALDYDDRVFVVDNKRISVTMRESVFDALYLIGEDMTAKEITEYLENEGMHSSIYVAVNTLEYLKKSGRVTAAGAAIGTLLGIKPVLQIHGGKLDAFKKVRGMKAAMDAMLEGIENDVEDRFSDDNIHIRAAYSGDKEVGIIWRDAVAERFPDYDIGLDALPISISCHTGPGALGIGVTRTRRNSVQ